MRKGIILIILALCTTGIIACCGIDTSTPEGTVKALLKASESHDATAFVGFIEEDYYHPVTSAQYIEQLENVYERYESTSITNLQITVESLDDNSATVLVSYHIHHILVPPAQEPVLDVVDNVSFSLIKTDGKWLISGFEIIQ